MSAERRCIARFDEGARVSSALERRVVGFPLDKEMLTPWYYQSYGRAKVPPLVTAESVVWATDTGHLYIGGADKLAIRSRLETGSEITSPPAYRKPFVYVATLSGEVFAIEEATGRKRWKYATGYTVNRAPAAVGNRVYVTSDEPMLHSIDAKTGMSQWEAPNVAQFAAMSRNRVYAVDELGVAGGVGCDNRRNDRPNAGRRHDTRAGE